MCLAQFSWIHVQNFLPHFTTLGYNIIVHSWQHLYIDIFDLFFLLSYSLSTLGVLKERVTFFTLLQEFRRALRVLRNVRVLTGEVTGAAGIMFVSFHSPSTRHDQNWHGLEILRQAGQLINNPPQNICSQLTLEFQYWKARNLSLSSIWNLLMKLFIWSQGYSASESQALRVQHAVTKGSCLLTSTLHLSKLQVPGLRLVLASLYPSTTQDLHQMESICRPDICSVSWNRKCIPMFP